MTENLRNAIRERLAGASDRQIVEVLFALFNERGQSHYDEDVTQLEHALQCAEIAQERGFGDEEVTAALLHDVGHLLLDEHDAKIGFLTEDLNHEELGAELLEEYFPPTVTEPIRLHVAAKRYLCTTDEDYYSQLSAASQRSFEMQGGRLSPQEKAELEANPGLHTALALRRIDDMGKLTDHVSPSIESYFETVIHSLRRDRRCT